MTSLLDAAADLLLGADCPGCHRPGFGLCQACRAFLTHCPPRRVARGVDAEIIAAVAYRPILSSVIPRYKDEGALFLAGALGRLLARSVAALGPPSEAVLVPMASRPATVRARGFDHAQRMALAASRVTGMKVTRLLRRTSSGGDQQGMTKSQRNRNLCGSMEAAACPWPLIIVDDVVTTGASLREAARALRTAGNHIIGAAVLADADKSRAAECGRLTAPFVGG